MSLREQIERSISASNGDTKQAAMEVCFVLEDEIGLQGNGWFDGDDEVIEYLGRRFEEVEPERVNAMRARLASFKRDDNDAV